MGDISCSSTLWVGILELALLAGLELGDILDGKEGLASQGMLLVVRFMLGVDDAFLNKVLVDVLDLFIPELRYVEPDFFGTALVYQAIDPVLSRDVSSKALDVRITTSRVMED